MAEEKDLGGRPPLFETPEELQNRVMEYFHQFIPGQNRDDQIFETHPTITGLCLFLGFESRQSFYDYEKREGFSYTIKKSRLMVENFYEHQLTDKNPAGPIFALKNMGWTDKQEIDHTTQGEKIQAVNYTGISDAALREIAGLDKPKGGTD